MRRAYEDSWAGEFAPFPEDYKTLEQARIDSPFAHLRDWDKKFNYLLVLNADHAPDLRGFLPELLEFRTQIGIAALFAVRKNQQAEEKGRSPEGVKRDSTDDEAIPSSAAMRGSD